MKATRRYAAGLAAIVTACITGAAGLLAGMAGSASAQRVPGLRRSLAQDLGDRVHGAGQR